MEIKVTYIGTLNNIPGIWCGFCPEEAVITEERNVLYPAEGYSLKRIATGEILSAVWLKDGDTQENYEEVPREDDTDYNELHLTRGDVFRGIFQAKGVKREQIRALIEAMAETTEEEKIVKELTLIDFDESLHFYRALPIIDKLGQQLGITPTQMTAFFVTNDWHKLLSEPPAADT
jgi:hypothetical protein